MTHQRRAIAHRHPLIWVVALACAAPPLRAADDAALDIADRIGEGLEEGGAARARDWQLSLETTLGSNWARDGSGATTQRRGTLALRVDTAPAPGWRLVLADQLDASDPALPGRPHTVNSLQEAYVGWQGDDRLALEAGRINLRLGGAPGYNPTDWFRAGALRGIPQFDPQRLRSSRLGTVALRGQWLWDGGALAGVAAPQLDRTPDEGSFEPDLAATNDRRRALLSLSQRWGARFSSQALLYKESGRPLQWGLSGSALVGDATTAFVEWTGGRDRSALSLATGGADDTRWRSRLAAGATYTTAHKLSLSVEYQYNGAGLDEDAWRDLARTSPPAVAALLAWSARQLDPPTRSAWFLHATWQDAGLPDLDLTALARFNGQDGSRLTWLELRWHAAARTDLTLQWRQLAGRAGSEYGSAPDSRGVVGGVTVWF